ncbi:MAG: hypothetical protein AB7F76_12260 [Parvibaculaceae bacterium]
MDIGPASSPGYHRSGPWRAVVLASLPLAVMISLYFVLSSLAGKNPIFSEGRMLAADVTQLAGNSIQLSAAVLTIVPFYASLFSAWCAWLLGQRGAIFSFAAFLFFLLFSVGLFVLPFPGAIFLPARLSVINMSVLVVFLTLGLALPLVLVLAPPVAGAMTGAIFGGLLGLVQTRLPAFDISSRGRFIAGQSAGFAAASIPVAWVNVWYPHDNFSQAEASTYLFALFILMPLFHLTGFLLFANPMAAAVSRGGTARDFGIMLGGSVVLYLAIAWVVTFDRSLNAGWAWPLSAPWQLNLLNKQVSANTPVIIGRTAYTFNPDRVEKVSYVRDDYKAVWLDIRDQAIVWSEPIIFSDGQAQRARRVAALCRQTARPDEAMDCKVIRRLEPIINSRGVRLVSLPGGGFPHAGSAWISPDERVFVERRPAQKGNCHVLAEDYIAPDTTLSLTLDCNHVDKWRPALDRVMQAVNAYRS